MKNFFVLGVLAFVFSISSCTKDSEDKQESGKLKFNVVLTDGVKPVNQNEVISLSNGQEINVSLFRLYFSNISLSQFDASTELLIKDVALLDPGVDGSNSFTVELDGATFSSIKFGLGVDAIQNDQNPGDFPNEHPLSTYQSMYWSMLKYRFAKFEGKGNLDGQLGSTSDVAIAFHPGTNPLYKKLVLPVNVTIKEGTTSTVNINININEIFAGNNPFDLTDGSETQTHSTASDIQIAEKFMENLKTSITIN